MAGILSRLNQGIRDAFARSDTTAEAPRPSGASTASRVMHRRTTGSGSLPPPLPRRPPPLPARPPRQDASAQNAAGIASPAAMPHAPRFTNPSLPASQGGRAAGVTTNHAMDGRPLPPPLPRRPPLQNAAAQTVAEIASSANRETEIRAFEIVAEQAEITSRNIDRRVETTVAQLQRDINAFNTHPPYVAHVAAAAAQGTAAQHLEAAGQALHAAQAQANTHEAEIQCRMAAATLAAEAGHPEQLQQLTLDTLAVQAAVNGAQQAALTAAEEFMAGNAMVRITAAAGEEMAATRQELVQHAQNLAQLEETQQLAIDAVVDAWTASNEMKKIP